MVYLRQSEQTEKEFINIEFSDQNSNSNIIIENKLKLTLGSLGATGCLLGRQPPEENLDEY